MGRTCYECKRGTGQVFGYLAFHGKTPRKFSSTLRMENLDLYTLEMAFMAHPHQMKIGNLVTWVGHAELADPAYGLMVERSPL
jgi:hypothetical protein